MSRPDTRYWRRREQIERERENRPLRRRGYWRAVIRTYTRERSSLR